MYNPSVLLVATRLSPLGEASNPAAGEMSGGLLLHVVPLKPDSYRIQRPEKITRLN